MQKAKIHWAIEGDENSKYFHAIINKKRVNLSVKGVMVDGDWIDDPGLVKQEFRSHFADRFQDPGSKRGSLNFLFPNRLSNDQILDLESSISKDEIRAAVWGCGVDKSPRPDDFTFEFFRKYWAVVGPNFSTAVEGFFKHGDFAIGCNSSFVALIPKVLDPKVVSDYRKASILVNGSPTTEFYFHRGLKQGDPLAPFMFLLIMESLHLSFSWAVEAGIFTGFRVDHSITLYHLFYADDAVFIGEWSHSNLKGIMNILRCFSLLSGMSINIQKSHLLGVGIPDNCVAEAAKSIGCSIMKDHFKYLGILVGDNMSSIKAWDEMIYKMKTRLSRWKLNTLFVGGRLTLQGSQIGL
uniref:RNA-directed DNA polymerase, eukaryota n=1 Tax=Tanacetum cinerariifolium TaxID=118510 RepID=A0A6L2LSI5_TANCI|nr:RNA-directed DNA polymerase, eukaryota [Tanacetum cinerariifolium]